MQENESSSSESVSSPSKSALREGGDGWIRLSAIAAASALAGGLAAAWYYRKTLNTLRNAASIETPPEAGMAGEDSEEDL